MQKILGTGLTGLVGSRITELLSEFEFTSVSRTNGVDITDKASLEKAFAVFDGEWVLHLAAKADVDGCENDRSNGANGEAWRINVLGAQNVAELCKVYNKKIIYISTDFVFDGTKQLGEAYVENDIPNPINWYGETKFEGENAIKNSGAQYLILRIAYPYGISSAEKKDFVRIIGGRLKEGKEIRGVEDHIICPTYIDDIAHGIQTCVNNNTLGLYHLVGNSHLSPYDIACLIAKKINASPDLISPTTREQYFANKAARPLNLYLNNDKIKTLKVPIRSFEEGLEQVEF